MQFVYKIDKNRIQKIFPCAPVAKINPINQFNKKSNHHTQKREFPLGTLVEQHFLL